MVSPPPPPPLQSGDVFDPREYDRRAWTGALQASVLGAPLSSTVPPHEMGDARARADDLARGMSVQMPAPPVFSPVLPPVIERWVRTITRPADLGSAHDTLVPAGLGVRQWGPDPRDFLPAPPPAGCIRPASRNNEPLYQLAAARGVGRGLIPQDPHMVAPGRLFVWGEIFAEAEMVPVSVDADLRLRRDDGAPENAVPYSTAMDGTARWLTEDPRGEPGHHARLANELALAPGSSGGAGGAAAGGASAHALVPPSTSSSSSSFAAPPGSFIAATGGYRCAFTVLGGGRAVAFANGDYASSYKAALSELHVTEGEGMTAGYRMFPLRTLLGKPVRALSCGQGFLVVLDRAGVVYTAGEGEDGVLGHGDTARRSSPQVVRALQGVVVTAIVAGQSHVLASCEPVRTAASGAAEAGVVGAGAADGGAGPTAGPAEATILWAWGKNAFGA